eukprot:1454296-Rhodomonas_salina.1
MQPQACLGCHLHSQTQRIVLKARWGCSRLLQPPSDIAPDSLASGSDDPPGSGAGSRPRRSTRGRCRCRRRRRSASPRATSTPHASPSTARRSAGVRVQVMLVHSSRELPESQCVLIRHDRARSVIFDAAVSASPTRRLGS